MRKLITVVGILIAIIAIAYVGIRIYTKSFSPQEVAVYDQHGVSLRVNYSRPFMQDREIFGNLVPYGDVWRTGANEATTFISNAPLQVNGQTLPAGEYSLFTRPGEEEWEVIFNSETGQWGISIFDGKPNRDPEKDVLTISVPSITTTDKFDQFTITFDDMSEEIDLIMMWENTMVVVPFTLMPD